MTPTADHYEILQVHPSADPEVIQAAYRRLALKYHPDVNHGKDAQQRMSQINLAYAVLNDPAQRAAYNRRRGGSLRTTAAGKSPASAAPVLRLSAITVDFGSVPDGRARTFSLRISNGGRGELSGVIASHVPWLKVTPTEFAGNLSDVILRFQPTAPGTYSSAQAMDVYSNGGRISVSVRGQLIPGRAQPPAERAKRAPRAGQVASRPTMELAKPIWERVTVPFSTWVVAGAIAGSIVWLHILPIMAVIPIGLAGWMLWERHFAHQAPVSPPQQETVRGSVLGRCNECGASINLQRASKCERCGGTVCTECRSCPCGYSKTVHA